MKRAQREPDSAGPGDAQYLPPGDSVRQGRKPQQYADSDESDDAGGLAEEKPRRDAERHGMKHVVDADPAKGNARVDEREHGQDRVRDGGMQVLFELSQGRASFGAAHGNAEGDENARKSRVHAGLQHGDPQHDTDEYVGRHPRYVESVQDHTDAQRGDAHEQCREGQVRRVEDRDDRDGCEVVEDGQRQQENLERRRYASTEDTQQSQCKRDVGGDRDPPAIECQRILPIERCIDGRRDRHASNCAKPRQHHLARGRQFALQEFAFDLESDEEEEHRHQPVVHP